MRVPLLHYEHCLGSLVSPSDTELAFGQLDSSMSLQALAPAFWITLLSRYVMRIDAGVIFELRIHL